MSDARRATPSADRGRDFSDYRRGRYANYVRGRGDLMAFRPDDPFFALADAVHAEKRTLLGLDRLYVLWQAARNVARVSGSVAEVGTYRGGSAWFLSRALAYFVGVPVPLTTIDTFEGHPAAAITTRDPQQDAGRFATTSVEDVRRYLEREPSVTVEQGEMRAVLSRLPGDGLYRLVHLDVDLYQPTLEALTYFVPRVSRGGIIVVDDYAAPKCQGVPEAVAHYMATTAERLLAWDPRSEQIVFVKMSGMTNCTENVTS